MNTPSLRIAGIAAIALAFSTGAAAGEAATAQLAGGGISITPMVAYEAARITMAGPDGRVSERRVGAGAPLVIQSAGLADGTYRYRVVLDVPAAERGAADPARPMAAPKTKEPRELSGHFTVAGGRIVDPASRPEQTR